MSQIPFQANIRRNVAVGTRSNDKYGNLVKKERKKEMSLT
jgi:hypothetical protein